jgi:hypothetical protein
MALNPQANSPAIPDRALAAFLDQLFHLVGDEKITADQQDEDQIDLSQFYLDALKHAGDSLVGRERILPLLIGRTQPTIDMARYDRGLALAEGFGLNGGQCEAFAATYAANLAQVLAEEGKRVFVASFTQRAINNALNKLAEAAPHVPAIKIGEPTRADGLRAAGVNPDDRVYHDILSTRQRTTRLLLSSAHS